VRGDADAKRAVCLSATASGTGQIALRKRIASLAFLHTAIFPADPDVRKAYFRRFLSPIDGVPIAACRITYAGGKTIDVPIRVGMEVGNWRPTRGAAYQHRCPYLLRLATEECRRSTPGGTDAVLYVYEWPNPHPGSRIDAIELTHTGVEATYALLALSARETK